MNRIAVTGIVAVTQLALVGVGVAPQLSARVAGEAYVVRVAPADPIDPRSRRQLAASGELTLETAPASARVSD